MSQALQYPLLAVWLVSLAAAALVAPRVVAGLRARFAATDDAIRRDRAVAWTAVAGTAGISSIVAAGLAYGLGGMRTLPWMWLGALVAAALSAAEIWTATAADTARARTSAPPPRRTLVETLGAGARGGKPLAALLGLVGALALLVGFGMLVAGEGFLAVSAITRTAPAGAAVLVAGLAVPLVFMPRRSGRAGFLATVPVFVGLWVLACLALALHDETSRAAAFEALRDAFVYPAPADLPTPRIDAPPDGTTRAGAMFIGMLAGLLAHQIGVGTLGSAAALDRVTRPARAAAAGALGPLVGGLVVATSTMLAFSVTTVPREQRIDHRELSAEDRERGASPDDLSPRMILPGPAHGRGLLPHLKYGQLIVLPEDTPLQDGKRYPMVFKAQPRGHMAGSLDPKRNVITVPDWAIARNVDTVVFRARKPELGRHPAYDVRVPVELAPELTWKKEELELPEEEREDVTLYVLRAKDPEVNFEKLAREMVGPFIVLEDFHFVGTVKRAMANEFGETLVMYEERSPRAPTNPVLRSVVSMGMVGPFFDTEDEHAGHGRHGSQRDFVPFVLAAEPGYDAAPGTKLHMKMRAPARGLAIGEVTLDDNQQGELRVPAWDFIAQTTHARLRHREDPAQDLLVPVKHRVAEDGTLRFWSAAPDAVMFKNMDRMRLFRDITLEVPDYAFDVEVRTGARLPAEFADRRALVPLHPAPYAGRDHRGIYRPHPAEVFASDMTGPWIAHEGGEWLGASLAQALEASPTGRYLLSLLLVLLGVAGVVAAASAGGRALEGALGSGAALGYQIAFVAAVAASPALAGAALTGAALWALAAAAILGATAVVVVALRAAR